MSAPLPHDASGRTARVGPLSPVWCACCNIFNPPSCCMGGRLPPICCCANGGANWGGPPCGGRPWYGRGCCGA